MLQYVKLIIITIITTLLAPLPASAGGHFAYLNNVMLFENNANTASLYLSIITLMFAVAALISNKKIIENGIKNANSSPAYKDMFACMGIGLLVTMLMFVPIGKDKLLFDYMSTLLVQKDMLVVSVSSILAGLLALVALLFSRNIKSKKKKINKIDGLRFSIYNLLSYIFPGFSTVLCGSCSVTLSGVRDPAIMSNVILYSSLPTFVVSVARIIRAITAGATIDPIMIAICAVISLVGNLLLVKKVSKVSSKKMLPFFAIYSIIFGIGAIVTAFNFM